jgi:4-hydroxythreonine-4-phosphate dehydrogenase
MGDPSGIGPEICLRALCEPAVLKRCVPVLFGDASVFRQIITSGNATWKKSSKALLRRAAALPIVPVAYWGKNGTAPIPTIVDCKAIGDSKVRPGRVSAACGRAGYEYIERAIRAAMRGTIDGVVTAPIHKEALQKSGVRHAGHTEIFTALTRARRSCMMLRSDALTVSMVTTHVGYAEVPQKLSVQRVLDVIELTADAIRSMVGRAARLGICGLNPHAGEHGLFGKREEERFVEPAVLRARKRGIDISGPLPPDAAFTTGQRKRFDAIVTLYHDQGHIPFKMLAFDTGVNVTLGLPIIRTSVDHGTAFDIAWKGIADPRSLYAAIEVAVELANGKRGVGRR